MDYRYLICFAALVAPVVLGSGAGFLEVWGYLPSEEHPYGPENWYHEYPACGQGLATERQTPIDLVVQPENIVLDEAGALALDLHWTTGEVEVLNKGSTVDISATEGSYFVDMYGKKYTMAGAHFHWHQTNNSLGSEHAIEGEFASMEAHFVHYDAEKYDNLTHAATSGEVGALSVIGLGFIVATDEEAGFAKNAELDKILALAEELNVPKHEGVVIPEFNPVALALNGGETATNLFYHYNGSLTTPGCFEVVRWYVLGKAIHITEEQMAEMRKFHHDNHTETLVHNSRPLQPTNGRKLVVVSPPAPLPSSSSTAAPSSSAAKPSSSAHVEPSSSSTVPEKSSSHAAHSSSKKDDQPSAASALTALFSLVALLALLF